MLRIYCERSPRHAIELMDRLDDVTIARVRPESLAPLLENDTRDIRLAAQMALNRIRSGRPAVAKVERPSARSA